MGTRLYNLDKLRSTIGEVDANDETTNRRLREAGEYSQGLFTQAMFNIGTQDDATNPIINPTEIEFELVNFGAVAYFYYLENGTEEMNKDYEDKLQRYIRGRFGRPKFKASNPL
jgi:hypothetical protein